MSVPTLSNSVGREEVAVRAAVEVGVAAVDDQRGALLDARGDVAGDLVAVRAGDQRPHVAAPGAVTGAQLAHPVLDLLDQVVGDRLDRDERRDRHAPLAGRAEARR